MTKLLVVNSTDFDFAIYQHVSLGPVLVSDDLGFKDEVPTTFGRKEVDDGTNKSVQPIHFRIEPASVIKTPVLLQGTMPAGVGGDAVFEGVSYARVTLNDAGDTFAQINPNDPEGPLISCSSGPFKLLTKKDYYNTGGELSVVALHYEQQTVYAARVLETIPAIDGNNEFTYKECRLLYMIEGTEDIAKFKWSNDHTPNASPPFHDPAFAIPEIARKVKVINDFANELPIDTIIKVAPIPFSKFWHLVVWPC